MAQSILQRLCCLEEESRSGQFDESLDVTGDLTVSGSGTFGGDLVVNGSAITLGSGATVITLPETAFVLFDGAADVGFDSPSPGNFRLTDATGLLDRNLIAGDGTFNGNLVVNGAAITLGSGAAVITLPVTAFVLFDGAADVGFDSPSAGNLRITDATGTVNRNLIAGAGTFSAPVKPGGYTVGTLPVGVVGQHAYVTDATAPTYLAALVGGGAVVCPVFYNGAAWVSH